MEIWAKKFQIVKCKNVDKERKKEMKRVIVITGTVLLTTSGKRILKKIKAWNEYAKIILLSGMNDLRKDKRVDLFREKKKSEPKVFDEIATILSETYEMKKWSAWKKYNRMRFYACFFYTKIYAVIFSLCSYSLTIFQNKLATVTGPTPPGTGVIAETLSKTFS